MPETYKYKAFISYSHSDEKWATWLHRSLENYKVPKPIVGKETAMGKIPARLAPVFRDRDELPSATNLGELLTRSLADSATQIVICSPAAAKSHWVNEEILTYKRLGRSNRIFCLIVGGEPWASDKPGLEEQECFPPALRHELGDNGELSDRRAEPIAADARAEGDGKPNARLKLISGMLGVGFDALKQREQHRRHQRMLVFTTAAFVGMAITSGLAVTAYLARNEAEEQRNRAEAEAETAKQTTQFMVGLFSVSDPSESLGNTITAREILDKGAMRIATELQDQPEIQATLMDTMGTVYTSLGLYPEAARLIDSSVAKRKEFLGAMHPDVAASLTHLGEVQTLGADYEEAEKNLRESLAMRRDLFGGTSLEVAETATELADVLSRQGEYAAAKPLIEESLSIRDSVHRSVHPDIAASLEDLGLNYYEQGNYESAVAYLRGATEMRRQIHGEIHPQLAEAINNLAWALVDQGELEEAEALLREALAMKRRLLGDLHPELASGINNLGYVLELRENLSGAETAYREALGMNRELLGDEHPEIAAVMSNLAFVLYAKGEMTAAIEQLRQTLEMRRSVFGVEHPATASTMTSLGFWLIDTGSYAESEKLLRESLAVRKQVLGEGHPQTAGTLAVLANLMIATGRFEEALQTARDARRILEQSVPDDHWLLAAATNVEGSALAGIGDYAQAEPLMLASLAGLEQAPIPNLAEEGRMRLADMYVAWGRPEEAAKYRGVQ
ncbi:MAG: toll/interleukin-1 receptor domain-containing protein [Gammaproteobacteria bacterium]|nr:toll/interleukin-1 receptor domain-containing protein [Gammaproteobacteria bacterium]NNL44893.1 toll/interleukin-1 receptor domain-containing protein [Woeseiaceae bacterium]